MSMCKEVVRVRSVKKGGVEMVRKGGEEKVFDNYEWEGERYSMGRQGEIGWKG